MIVDYKLSEPFNYDNDYEYSLKDTHSFFKDVSDKYSVWDKPFDKVYDFNKETNKSEWFKGGLINACYNSLDKQIKNGRGDQAAFVYEIPIKKLTFKITYKELHEKVCVFSRVLVNLGISKGDMVLIYMHNSFEAIISMLSCARIGAIHNVVYNGTLSEFVSNSIDQTKPSLVICSNFGLFLDDAPHYYLPILKEALKKSTHKPKNVIVYNRNDIPDVDYNDSRLSNTQIDGSIDWFEINKSCSSNPLIQHVPVESNHPLYVSYSSGTTNKPKGIIRETGGHVVVLNYDLRHSVGLKDGDSVYIGTPFGWVSAHSFLIYGMLMVGGTSVFSEGPIIDPSNEIYEIASRNKVQCFVLTPLFIRRIRILDPNGINSSKYDLSSLRTILVGGEKVDQALFDYLGMSFKNVHLLVAYGQTETGTSVIGHPTGVPSKGVDLGKPVPGFNIKIVKSSKTNPSKPEIAEQNEIGEIAIKLPLPPCVATSLFNDDINTTQYKSSYLNKFEGYYATGDLAFYDQDGYIHFVSRVGDSITCGNHSIDTGAIQTEILTRIPLISECSIVAINHEILSSIPGVFYVLKKDSNDQELLNSIQTQIETFFLNLLQTNAKFKPLIVKLLSIPKNRNGKSITPLIRSIFNGEQYIVPATIENENVIGELLEEYRKIQSNKPK